MVRFLRWSYLKFKPAFIIRILYPFYCLNYRYVKDGRQGQLVEKCRRGGTVELAEKLAEHPTLSWVQSALTDDLRFSANTLHSLAIQENELVTRKKVREESRLICQS